MVEVSPELFLSWPDGKLSYHLADGDIMTGIVTIRTGRLLLMQIVIDAVEDNGMYFVGMELKKGKWRELVSDETKGYFDLTECSIKKSELGVCLKVKEKQKWESGPGEGVKGLWGDLSNLFKDVDLMGGDENLKRCIQQLRSIVKAAEIEEHPIEKTIRYQFKDQRILMSALTSPSFAHENGLVKDYQKLEYIGDGVLRLAIRRFLMEHYPENSEAELTRSEAALTSNVALIDLGIELDLIRYVKFGADKEKMRYKKIHADVVEAIIGAVFTDSNFEEASKVIWILFGEKLLTSPGNRPGVVMLYERCAKEGKKIDFDWGEEAGSLQHHRMYYAKCLIDQLEMGKGSASSAKKARQIAAIEAYQNMYDS